MIPDGLEDLIERFDHVALAVHDVPATLPLVRFMGGVFLDGGDNTRKRFRWVQFTLPGSAKLELIQPLEGNDWLVRHLERRGEGVHHMTFKVTNLDAAVDRAHTFGLETTGYSRTPLWSEVFIHPKTAHGVVIQLAEWSDGRYWATSYEDVLAGRVIDAG
jgi:methylmalonyl-CoA/ethylmalonyl-CoA epimerase